MRKKERGKGHGLDGLFDQSVAIPIVPDQPTTNFHPGGHNEKLVQERPFHCYISPAMWTRTGKATAAKPGDFGPFKSHWAKTGRLPLTLRERQEFDSRRR